MDAVYEFRNHRDEVIAQVNLKSDNEAVRMKDDIEKHSNDYVFSILRIEYKIICEYDLSGNLVK